MPTPWSDIAKKPEYKALPMEEKEAARRQYFDSIVAPKVPQEDVNLAWEQFSESAGKYDKGPSLISKTTEAIKEGVTRLKGTGIQKPAAGGGYGGTTPISTVTGKPVASDWTTDPMWKGMPETTKEWALDQIISKKMTFEQVKAELGGIKISAYDPTDIAIDVATLGTSAVGRRAVKAGLKPALKFAGEQLLAGAGAGAGLAVTMDTDLGILPQFASAALGSTVASSLLTALRVGGKQGILKLWQKHADNIATKKLAAKTGKELAEVAASEKKFRQTLTDYYAKNQKTIAATLSDIEKAELPELAFVNGQWVQVPQKVRVEKDIAQTLAGGIEAKAMPGESPADALRREAERIRTGQVTLPPGQQVIRRERTFLPESEMAQPAKAGKITKFTTKIPTETPAEQLRRAGKVTTTGQKWLATGKEIRKRGDTTLSFLGTGKIKEFLETPTGREVGGAAIGAGIGAAAADDDDRFTGAIVGAGVGYGTAKGGEAILRRIFRGSKQSVPQTEAWNKVRGMIGEEKRSFSISGVWGNFKTKILDRFEPLKKVSPQTYDATMAFSAHKDVAKIKFDELKDIFSKVKNDELLVTDYINAHRAMTRAERGLKNPNKVTLEDAKQTIKDIEGVYAASGKNVSDLQEAFKGFQKWTHDYILKETLDNGLISKAAYDDIVKNNKFYATFDVLDHLPENIHDIPSLPSKEYFSVANQDIIKGMIGTEKKIANPLEATIRKFTHAQATFARNKVASIFVDDPTTKGLLRPVAGNIKEFAIMKQQGLNPISQGSWNKNDFDVISRFKDGNVEKYLAPKEFADTMKQLTPRQAPRVVQALSSIFRASATTLYVPFTISNAMRDALMAYTTAPVYKATAPHKFAKDWFKGFWEGARHEFLGKSDLAESYIKSGGGFGYVGNLRNARLAKAELFKKGIVKTGADIITSPFKLIEKLSATVELAPRLGTFDRGIIEGMPKDDAALMAKASTINFNKGGTVTKVVNQFVPFLNARVQGRLTLASALKRDPKGTLAKIFMATVLPGLGAYAWNRMYYSEYYDDIPEYIKQNYFTIITGTEKNEKGKIVPRYLVMAKGDVGQMAFNPIEFAMDKMWKKDRQGTTAFFINYLNDLSPVEFAREGEVSASKLAGGLLPPIVKGFAEDWANLSMYRGTEIVPYYMGKTKPPELQYKENTPESYKWLGKKLAVSPLRLQNFAGNILAGYGREGLDPSAMMRGLTGRLVKTTAGAKEQQTWVIVKDIEQGYNYTRAYAEEIIAGGDRKAANRLMSEWNDGLDKRIQEITKFGFKDKGGLKRSYMFTPQKRKELLLKRRDETKSPLERKLSRQRD